MRYRNFPILGLMEADSNKRKATDMYARCIAELDVSRETAITCSFLLIISILIAIIAGGASICQLS